MKITYFIFENDEVCFKKIIKIKQKNFIKVLREKARVVIINCYKKCLSIHSNYKSFKEETKIVRTTAQIIHKPPNLATSQHSKMFKGFIKHCWRLDFSPTRLHLPYFIPELFYAIQYIKYRGRKQYK